LRQAARGSIAGAICRFNDIDKVAQPSSRPDKQILNTALALLDTVTKPARVALRELTAAKIRNGGFL
jgi:hypothetical protein